ncbi:MAG: PRC-barrel domain-containing protein [Rhodothalassiaceae bacterium]
MSKIQSAPALMAGLLLSTALALPVAAQSTNRANQQDRSGQSQAESQSKSQSDGGTDCRTRLHQIDQQFLRHEGRDSGAMAGLRSELKTLRDAANILARYEHQDACRTVLTSLKEIAEDRSQKMAQAETQQSDKDGKGSGTTRTAAAAGAGGAAGAAAAQQKSKDAKQDKSADRTAKADDKGQQRTAQAEDDDTQSRSDQQADSQDQQSQKSRTAESQDQQNQTQRTRTAKADGKSATAAKTMPKDDAESMRGKTTQLVEMTGKMRAKQLLDMSVFNFDRVELGSVEDILLAGQDRTGYLIIGHGGFLGMVGERQIAVPYTRIRVGADLDRLYLDMSEEKVGQLPSFESGDYSWVGDQTWQGRNDAFYEADASSGS